MKKYLKYIIVLAVFLAAGCAVYTAPATGQSENYAGADKISFLRQAPADYRRRFNKPHHYVAG